MKCIQAGEVWPEKINAGEMELMNGYFGIDLAQMIFGGAVILVLIGFAVWGFRTTRRHI
ncbi:MAG: hypothetical protein ACYCXF_08005 [Thermoleophilia bacterium]